MYPTHLLANVGGGFGFGFGFDSGVPSQFAISKEITMARTTNTTKTTKPATAARKPAVNKDKQAGAALGRKVKATVVPACKAAKVGASRSVSFMAGFWSGLTGK